jgi:hypothetical protein
MTIKWKWSSSGYVIGLLQAPGQNSWTLESSPGPDVRRMSSCLATELRDKRKRDGDNDDMDVCFVLIPANKKNTVVICNTCC